MAKLTLGIRGARNRLGYLLVRPDDGSASRKEPIFHQLPKNNSKVWFDPKSNISDLSTPLAPSHLDMDMSYTMNQQEREGIDECLDNIFEKC